MLRIRVQRCTGSTGVTLTVTHGLGVTLDFWALAPRNTNARAAGRPVGNYPNATHIWVADFLGSTNTLDVLCIAYQGRLY